jgi:hypothetical protein
MSRAGHRMLAAWVDVLFNMIPEQSERIHFFSGKIPYGTPMPPASRRIHFFFTFSLT